MISYRQIGLALVVGAFFLLTGCGNGGGQTVTAPTLNNGMDVSNHASADSRHLWGLWDVTIDPISGQCDIVPLRTANFTANVNNLLSLTPGNFQVSDLDASNFQTEGRLDCTVTIKHPFPGLDRFNGFDVCGVFLHNGESALGYDGLTYGDGPDAGENEAILLNADGYTRWFNQPEFDGDGIPLFEYWPGTPSNLPEPTAMLNGYRIFTDGLDTEQDYYGWIKSVGNADDRNIFRAYSVNSRRYEFKFPMIDDSPKLNFQFAVVATWEEGDPALTGDPILYDPEDYPVSANCDEAFFVHASTVASDLYYVDVSTYGGDFVADIEVFDWQGGYGGNGVPNEIERVIIEGDFIPGGSHEFSQVELAAIAYPGTENSSVFQVEIVNCTPQASGEAELWVIVESAGLNGGNYDQGFPTTYPDPARRASFQRGTVGIDDEHEGLNVISIDPDTVPFWSMVEDAVITGESFQNGATVELRKDGEDPVAGTDIVFVSDTHLECDFDLKGADSGMWDVVVINPDMLEGILDDGFTIEVWSDEFLIDSGSYRLPALAERQAGPIVLAAGCNDSTLQYMIWDPLGDGWEGPYLLANKSSNSMIVSLASDPTDDSILCASGPTPYYRYTGGTDPWESAWQPIIGCRTLVVTVDPYGRLHIIDNSSNAFGWIIHVRATDWGVPDTGWDILGDYFADGYNELVINESNILDYDSMANMHVIYVKDHSLNPYSGNPSGPRWIRVTTLPDSGLSDGYTTIEYAHGVDDALDSPALTCDPDDVLHATYRKFDTDLSEWQICYEKSTTGGTSWTPGPTIWQGVSEPGSGYIYLLSDSDGHLHSVYIMDGFFEYKSSDDGSSWSDIEIADPDKPPGDDDFMPKVFVTSDDIMHVAWIRGDKSSGYGDICHRMRDLL